MSAPALDDLGDMRAEFRPFFLRARERRLAFPRCGACGRFHWYPAQQCPNCGSADIAWIDVDPRGTLFAWTVVRRAVTGAFAGKIPYIVGLVEFADAPGVRLVTNLVQMGPQDLAEGMALEPLYTDLTTPCPRVVFRPRCLPL